MRLQGLASAFEAITIIATCFCDINVAMCTQISCKSPKLTATCPWIGCCAKLPAIYGKWSAVGVAQQRAAGVSKSVDKNRQGALSASSRISLCSCEICAPVFTFQLCYSVVDLTPMLYLPSLLLSSQEAYVEPRSQCHTQHCQSSMDSSDQNSSSASSLEVYAKDFHDDSPDL